MNGVPQWLVWVLAAAAVYSLLAWGASRQLYFPLRYPEGDWRAGDEIGARDVWVRDGLHGWFARRAGATLATLHLHGNAGNVTHRTMSARHILAGGSSVLLLDYRGYGRSSGRPTESGLYEDAKAAYEWLLASGYKPGQIVLHGESIGTAVAVQLAASRSCAGVVLEAPFTSAKAVAARVLPLLGPALIWGFDSTSRIHSLRAPLLIVHGDADEIIAYEFGRELYAAAPEPKSFWTIRGATHNDLHIAGAAEFPSRLKAFYGSLPQSVVNHSQ